MGASIPHRTYVAAGPPRGAVIFFHGLSASSADHEREGRSLAAAGMTALLPDAPHHGARRSGLLDRMRDATGLEAHRILLQLLREARDEIPTLVEMALGEGHPRVAIAGISMGAYVALSGPLVEPRLAAVVSILGSPDWRPRQGEVPDDLVDAGAEAPERHPERFPPRPLLLINGALDEHVPPEPARRFAEQLRPLYAGAGAGPLVHREYPHAGHFPSTEDWDDLWGLTVGFLRDVFVFRQ